MLTVGFHTLGCKVNQQETSAMAAQFTAAGFRIVSYSDRAEVYVINSCAVTEAAERKTKTYARRKKKMHPTALVVLAGCFPQVALNDARALEVDLLVGSNDKSRLVTLVQAALTMRGQHVEVTPWADNAPFDFIAEDANGGRTRGMLKVQDGCEQYCSYCIIPYARGRERSLDLSKVLGQAQRLIEQGTHEIVLTGIHLGAYGRDLVPPLNLATLVRELGSLPYLPRLRLGSVEPLDITAEFLEAVKNSPQSCPHFHLPLQSGSNAVLRRMKRPYTVEEFAAIVSRLRSVHADVSITSDIIVGFPGETDEEFHESLAFVRAMEFGRLHVFRYSRRRGTVAAAMAEQVSDEVKEVRYQAMQAVAALAQQDMAKRFLNRTVEVLVEGKQGELLSGYSPSYLRVYFSGSKMLVGRLVNITVTELYADGVRGDLAE